MRFEPWTSMTAIAGDGNAHPVTVKRGQVLVVNGVNGSVDLSSNDDASNPITIPADTPFQTPPLGDQTLYVKAAGGTTIQLATC